MVEEGSIRSRAKAMKLLNRLINKAKAIRLRGSSPEKRAELLRNQLYHVGTGVKLWTYYFGTEPYLISIHDYVIVAANVHFINHDVSAHTIRRFLDKPESYTIDKVNKIELMDNCMVGAFSVLMPGVTVGKNSIVAAGSVVTKSIPDNEIWGGAPARFIMTTEEYAKKQLEISDSYPWMQNGKMLVDVNSKEMVRMRQQYFFEQRSMGKT